MLGPEAEAQLPGRIITETGWNAYYIRDYELVRSRAGEFEYVAPFYNWLFTNPDSRVLRTALTGSALRIVDHRRECQLNRSYTAVGYHSSFVDLVLELR
jgi:hypothetical protein